MESSLARESLERIADIAGLLNDESLETVCVSMLAAAMFRSISIMYEDGSEEPYEVDRREDNTNSINFVIRAAREAYNIIRDGV